MDSLSKMQICPPGVHTVAKFKLKPSEKINIALSAVFGAVPCDLSQGHRTWPRRPALVSFSKLRRPPLYEDLTNPRTFHSEALRSGVHVALSEGLDCDSEACAHPEG